MTISPNDLPGVLGIVVKDESISSMPVTGKDGTPNGRLWTFSSPGRRVNFHASRPPVGTPLFDFTNPVDPTGQGFDQLSVQLAAANAELRRRYGPRIFWRNFGAMLASAAGVASALERLGSSAQAAVASAAAYERNLAYSRQKYGEDWEEDEEFSPSQAMLESGLFFNVGFVYGLTSEREPGTQLDDEVWRRMRLWARITPWWFPEWAQNLTNKIANRWPVRWLPGSEGR